MAVLPGAAPLASLDVGVSGLRSTRGVIRVCVTMDAKDFPDCSKDPSTRRLSVSADKATDMVFPNMPSGGYAIALFHDENSNGRIDTRFGIPTEGIGFSNNPKLWFGPPSFAQARFALTDKPVGETVKLKYFL